MTNIAKISIQASERSKSDNCSRWTRGGGPTNLTKISNQARERRKNSNSLTRTREGAPQIQRKWQKAKISIQAGERRKLTIVLKLMDHPRASRSAGGTGLLFRDSLQVTMVASRERESFEFSEWLVISGTYRLRVIVIYRVPYSTEHPVSTKVFFFEFSDCMESVYWETRDLGRCQRPCDADARKHQDFFECLGLDQHVR